MRGVPLKVTVTPVLLEAIAAAAAREQRSLSSMSELLLSAALAAREKGISGEGAVAMKREPR